MKWHTKIFRWLFRKKEPIAWMVDVDLLDGGNELIITIHEKEAYSLPTSNVIIPLYAKI